MPSKSSEELQQAIQYIKAGELEIAKEIILGIIQKDPGYEKAWIWLVETISDRAGKIEILTTRLDQFVESPLSRKALERLAPELMNQYLTEQDAVYIPPDARKEQQPSEAETAIKYNVSSEDFIDQRLDLDDDLEIEFEEPEVQKESYPNTAAVRRTSEPLEMRQELLADTGDDKDGEEVVEDDLEAFLRGDLNFDQVAASAEKGEMNFTDWLAGEQDRIESEENQGIDELSFLMGQEVVTEEKPAQKSTSSSNPFVMTPQEAAEIFGGAAALGSVLEEEGDATDAVETLRKKTSESQRLVSPDGLDMADFDDDMFSDEDQSAPVSIDDLLELGNNLRTEVVGKTPPSGTLRPTVREDGKRRAKKRNSTNTTFIFGCSVLAAIIIISLIGIAWLVWPQLQEAQSRPTSTPTLHPTVTPTAEYTLVAPWLLERTPTPTPELEGN